MSEHDPLAARTLRRLRRETALGHMSYAVHGAASDAAVLIASADVSEEAGMVERELRDLVLLLDAQRTAASLRVSLLTKLY